MLPDRHGGDAAERNAAGRTPLEETRVRLGLTPRPHPLGATVIGGLLREGLIEFQRWLETLDGAYVDSKSNAELIDEFLDLQGIPK